MSTEDTPWKSFAALCGGMAQTDMDACSSSSMAVSEQIGPSHMVQHSLSCRCCRFRLLSGRCLLFAPPWNTQIHQAPLTETQFTMPNQPCWALLCHLTTSRSRRLTSFNHFHDHHPVTMWLTHITQCISLHLNHVTSPHPKSALSPHSTPLNLLHRERT